MSSKLETTGTIHHIAEAEQITDTFKKRLFVVSVESGPYTETIPFELMQDNVNKIDGFKVGETVTVSFNLRGREYNGRYFVNLNAWKIDRGQSPPVNETKTEVKIVAPPQGDDGGDDSLPF